MAPSPAQEGMEFWDPPCEAKPKVIGVCFLDKFAAGGGTSDQWLLLVLPVPRLALTLLCLRGS